MKLEQHKPSLLLLLPPRLVGGDPRMPDRVHAHPTLFRPRGHRPVAGCHYLRTEPKKCRRCVLRTTMDIGKLFERAFIHPLVVQDVRTCGLLFAPGTRRRGGR